MIRRALREREAPNRLSDQYTQPETQPTDIGREDAMISLATRLRSELRINALDCTDSHCKSMNVTHVAQVRPDARTSIWNDTNTYHETWKGKAHRGK